MKEEVQRRIAATEGLAFHTLSGLIAWSDDFKTGEPIIDAQHKAIFALASEATTLSRSPQDLDRLREVFEEFGVAITEHFAFEEHKLTELHHPTHEAHWMEHKAILKEFEFIRERLAHEAEGWSFQEKSLAIVNFMIGVTVGHSLKADATYFSEQC